MTEDRIAKLSLRVRTFLYSELGLSIDDARTVLENAVDHVRASQDRFDALRGIPPQSGDEREQIISIIEDLWPPDTDHAGCAADARQMLADAVCAEWRTLPLPVLRRHARLCVERDHDSAGTTDTEVHLALKGAGLL